ncbi:MAG TPA: twin-arginine translocase TatA/TatE family subunit [Stellaceae bacterium]
MGSMSIWHWLVVLAVGLLLFGGRGKLTNVMGDFAKGIKAFKQGMKEEEEPETATASPAQVTPPPAAATVSAEPKREHA